MSQETTSINNAREKKSILFVCLGNRERSVIAENLLRQRLLEDYPQLAGKVVISSAGIVPRAYVRHAQEKGIVFSDSPFDKRPSIYAIQYLAKKGMDISSYRSQGLRKDMVLGADLILAVDSLIKEEVLHSYPEASNVFTFKEFAFGANWSNLDIGDPMKLPDLDKETGAWVWPEGYPDSYIAEIEECLWHGINKLVQYIQGQE